MRALWIQGGRAELRYLPAPRPGPGQALLRPILAGIYGTDLELLAGYYAFAWVPRHDLVAVVGEAPGRPDMKERRMVADINVGCG